MSRVEGTSRGVSVWPVGEAGAACTPWAQKASAGILERWEATHRARTEEGPGRTHIPHVSCPSGGQVEAGPDVAVETESRGQTGDVILGAHKTIW